MRTVETLVALQPKPPRRVDFYSISSAYCVLHDAFVFSFPPFVGDPASVYVRVLRPARFVVASAKIVATLCQVGSVSTIITEQLQERGLQMEEAEATLLALGVHSDTGSLTFDSATARWVGRDGTGTDALQSSSRQNQACWQALAGSFRATGRPTNPPGLFGGWGGEFCFSGSVLSRSNRMSGSGILGRGAPPSFWRKIVCCPYLDFILSGVAFCCTAVSLYRTAVAARVQEERHSGGKAGLSVCRPCM